MTSLKAQTSLIDLDKTDLAKDARPHDPAALEILAHDMGEQGQLQEIIVVRVGGTASRRDGVAPNLRSADTRYEVIAGVGRTLAARKLGWQQIRASIREGVSDFDKARITFAENEDREDADPFYQAGLIQRMLRVRNCSRKVLGAVLGISDALIDAYVAIQGLPVEISRIPKRLGIGLLIQIARLTRSDSKIELAQKCAKSDLSVRQVKALVDRILKKPTSSPVRRPAVPQIPDPLSKLWEKLHDGEDLPLEVWWETHYGIHKVKDGPELTGHFFFVSPQPEFSAHALAAWFRGMANALEVGKANNKKPVAGRLRSPAASDVAAVSAVADVPKVLAMFTPRLPKNSAEKSELAELSVKKGPKAVYAWIYGPNSPMTQAVPVNTWKEIGTTPKEGLKQILDGLQSFGKISA